MKLQQLQLDAERYELFAAMRLVERAHPDQPRLGHAARPADEPVRLHQTPSLAFAASQVDCFVAGAEGTPSHLYGLAPGLFGPFGALPLHLTEYAIGRASHARDDTFTAFADLFHHRMLCLFYRAWADAQPVVHADRPEADRFAAWTGALVGTGTPATDGRDAFPDAARRHFSGRLLGVACNAEGLRALVQAVTGAIAEVVEFVAEWMSLPADAHLRLGGGEAVASLGQSSVLGARVRGAQQRVRLRLGPLTRDQFQQMLPGAQAMKTLTAAVRSYLGDATGWDVQLVLRSDHVPRTRLGIGGRLGLDSWLGQRSYDLADADEVILHPAA
ncbi:type VI secretion system baseplate subunit TssG [Pseudoxanthomonas sp.]|uniref:type VI secretion system baseplate subunit TssG n=1 Tax=Pseudoxanthomonas sp. TaxID=1871049 RepID=UPI00262DE97E|nr:type VI secretion system baseplate subunit TssG [Pseudoxanthomonas sp.]WDS37814.1 MAG: type VI secretion system baseplate subunit TssG [Pseudoxanthomonas sp.]